MTINSIEIKKEIEKTKKLIIEMKQRINILDIKWNDKVKIYGDDYYNEDYHTELMSLEMLVENNLTYIHYLNRLNKVDKIEKENEELKKERAKNG